MMGLFSSAGAQLRRTRGGSEGEGALEGSEPSETSVLDENEGSIIASMISQLRIGMDLSKVAFPTFVLEPRSMLERISDFMSHPDIIFGAEKHKDPDERFMHVLSYYLAGWHIKPRGVKKPYNPVLGEFFRCKYNYPDGTQGFYIAEQVSHHPPISAFFYVAPENRISIVGELRPKAKFLGNSVSTTMEGENRVRLLGAPQDGEYVVTMPNMYARGILFGKMVLELGDTCTARNDQYGLVCDLDFKTKGFFSGSYNVVVGRVKKDKVDLGEVSGKWTQVMDFKDAKTGEKRTLFDAVKDGEALAPRVVAPESEQEPYESRRLWLDLTKAILAKDMDAATAAKGAVEDAQRDKRKLDDPSKPHKPRFFEHKDGHWEPKFTIPDDPTDAKEAVQQWIWASSTTI